MPPFDRTRDEDEDEDKRFAGNEDSMRDDLAAAFEAFDEGKLTAENAHTLDLKTTDTTQRAPAGDQDRPGAQGGDRAQQTGKGDASPPATGGADDKTRDARDQRGRFTKGEGEGVPPAGKPGADTKPGATATTEQPASQQPEGQPAATPPEPAPQGLSAQATAVWDKATAPEVRDYIRQTEGVLTQLQTTMAPVFEGAREHGIKWDHYVGNLVKADKALQKDPMYSLLWLAERHGVDPDALADMAAAKRAGLPYQPQQQTQQQNPDFNRAVQPLAAQVQEINSKLQQREQAETQQRQDAETARRNAVRAEIDAFAKSAAAPDWETVKNEVWALVPVVRAGKPDASVTEIVKDAYDRAIWAHPTLRTKLQTTEQRRTQNTQREQRSGDLESLTGHRGSPAATTRSNGTGKGDNLRDEIAANWAAYDQR
jgi:hypothetical protein